MLRSLLEATGGYDFGPIVAIVIGLLLAALLALAVVVWLVWRFAGRARWPLLGGLFLVLGFGIVRSL